MELGYMNWKIINPNNIIKLVETFDNLIEDHHSIYALFDRVKNDSEYLKMYSENIPESSRFRQGSKLLIKIDPA